MLPDPAPLAFANRPLATLDDELPLAIAAAPVARLADSLPLALASAPRAVLKLGPIPPLPLASENSPMATFPAFVPLAFEAWPQARLPDPPVEFAPRTPSVPESARPLPLVSSRQLSEWAGSMGVKAKPTATTRKPVVVKRRAIGCDFGVLLHGCVMEDSLISTIVNERRVRPNSMKWPNIKIACPRRHPSLLTGTLTLSHSTIKLFQCIANLCVTD